MNSPLRESIIEGLMVKSGADILQLSTSEIAPGIWQLTITGSVDWSNFTRVEAAFEQLFDKNIYRIVVNLRDTKYISSAGFGCFISSLDVAMKNNGDVVYVGTPPDILDVFNILGLCNILRFADSEVQALDLLQK